MAIRSYTKDGTKLYEIYLNAVGANGKRYQVRRKGITSLRLAQAQEFELKRKMSDQKENPTYSWGEWLQLCIDKMKIEFKPSTVMNYDGQLRKWTSPIWKDKPIKEITSSEVHSLIFEKISDVSPTTRKTILKMLKRIFKMAIEDGVINHNPALKVRVRVPERKQAVFNATEVDTFLKEAKRIGHKFYEIWAVALLTGMRSGELYALKWTDIDLENRRITISQSWCSKNGFGPTKSATTRIVPVCVELELLLTEMKLKKGPGYEFVLPHVTEWTRGSQANVIRSFCKIIGITPIKFHDLRATFITQLLLKGVSLAQVMAIVGHKELKTTNIYLRLAGADLIGATDKLGFTLPKEQLASVIQMRLGLS